MSRNKDVFLTCLDYTVSNKKFDLLYNSKFEMLETFPKPEPEELPFYYESEDYISHTDSKKSLIEKLYQIVKKYALHKKLMLINSFNTDGKNILDVGCGTGDFLFTCKNNNWDVVGVEPNDKAQKNAKNKLGENTKIYSNIDELDNKFDVITLWHVLEHVPNLDEYISKLKTLLKPNGVLVIAVPNFKSFDANHYKQFWAAFDVPRHLWHFSKKSIQLLFEKQKMDVVKILPMKFDSFYVSLLSEKYKTGNNNFFKAFCLGLLSNIKASTSKEYSSLIYIIKNV
ncbi:bifunctional 2-polyprenyl-6-hydroxyphenol methylase/3-demethylubiquinol 3-O-methyltransferase UbiG [Lutibacter sp. B1]|uniref:class I SAM-dependent methyltransferase n=1 Tax=Lutibacter sp. B1 TaxID=2725996 RepID=UPI0014568474|nr:class I SAM-dependent methyltransferase [Lutibacter sp. B1]NLP59071.1 class I SAM-dependent methyltransferase [Lutibacter sp. B1]